MATTFFAWASLEGSTRAFFEGALRLDDLRRNSNCGFNQDEILTVALIRMKF